MAAWENVTPEEALRSWEDLPAPKREEYLAMCGRLRRGYPLDYLLPYTEINTYSFRLREGVLIPRPETEELIEIIRRTSDKPPTLVDVGCGSGIIGISLSEAFEQVVMLDISPQALEITQENITLNNTPNAQTYSSDLLEQLPRPRGEWWLVANLPYVPEIDKQFAREYRTEFEPDLAIYAGPDGLDLFRRLVAQLTQLEHKPRKLFFELDPRNIKEAQAMISQKLTLSSRIYEDTNGRNRFLVC